MPQNHLSPPPQPDRTSPRQHLSAGPFPAAHTLAGWAQELPLQGVTILAVEDSRFACEALRLMTRRAGARLRRAETIEAARGHLRVYRPDVVLIDLGLPDGRGEVLIRDLVLSQRRPPVVLGMSGNPEGRLAALAAGADGFLEKPIENTVQLCRALRPLMPDLDIQPPPLGQSGRTLPDPLALHDDLAFAARALRGEPGPTMQGYVAAFLSGIAAHARDAPLADAVRHATDGPGLDRLRIVLDERLAKSNAFDRGELPPSASQARA